MWRIVNCTRSGLTAGAVALLVAQSAWAQINVRVPSPKIRVPTPTIHVPAPGIRGGTSGLGLHMRLHGTTDSTTTSPGSNVPGVFPPPTPGGTNYYPQAGRMGLDTFAPFAVPYLPGGLMNPPTTTIPMQLVAVPNYLQNYLQTIGIGSGTTTPNLPYAPLISGPTPFISGTTLNAPAGGTIIMQVSPGTSNAPAGGTIIMQVSPGTPNAPANVAGLTSPIMGSSWSDRLFVGMTTGVPANAAGFAQSAPSLWDFAPGNTQWGTSVSPIGPVPILPGSAAPGQSGTSVSPIGPGQWGTSVIQYGLSFPVTIPPGSAAPGQSGTSVGSYELSFPVTMLPGSAAPGQSDRVVVPISPFYGANAGSNAWNTWIGIAHNLGLSPSAGVFPGASAGPNPGGVWIYGPNAGGEGSGAASITPPAGKLSNVPTSNGAPKHRRR